MSIRRIYDKVKRLLRTENLPLQHSDLMNWIAEALHYYLTKYPFRVGVEYLQVLGDDISSRIRVVFVLQPDVVRVLQAIYRTRAMPSVSSNTTFEHTVVLQEMEGGIGYCYTVYRDNLNRLRFEPKFIPQYLSGFEVYTQRTLSPSEMTAIRTSPDPPSLEIADIPVALEDIVAYRVAGEIFNSWYGEESNYGDKYLQMAEEMAQTFTTTQTFTPTRFVSTPTSPPSEGRGE